MNGFGSGGRTAVSPPQAGSRRSRSRRAHALSTHTACGSGRCQCCWSSWIREAVWRWCQYLCSRITPVLPRWILDHQEIRSRTHV